MHTESVLLVIAALLCWIIADLVTLSPLHQAHDKAQENHDLWVWIGWIVLAVAAYVRYLGG
jgi:hypothetical protein